MTDLLRLNWPWLAFPTERPLLNAVIGSSVLLLVLLAVYHFCKSLSHWLRQEWAFYGVPSPPVADMFQGHGPFVFDSGKGLDWFVNNAKKYPRCYRLRLGPFNFMGLNHPETAKQFFGSEPKLEFIYIPLYPWLGESILTGSGPKWQRTRRLLTPSFHFDILKPYIKVFSDSADILIEKWSSLPERESIEVFHHVSLLTLDVMLKCTCSFDSNCQIVGTHDEYIKSVYDLSRLVYQRVTYFLYYWDFIYFRSKPGKEFSQACKIVHNFSMEVIKKRRKELEVKKGNTEQPITRRRKYLDFIDTLLEAKDESNVGMTDEEIRAEVDTFMFEGHDTTASGISWALYNLAKHPEHLVKCHEEVDDFFDSLDDDNNITWNDLTREGALEYLTMCLKESMRMYPPVASVGRLFTKETTFDGHTMPPDTMSLLFIYALHHNPAVWENPEVYDPLRFTKENINARSPYAYVPFAAGSRNCIGQNFAINEEKVVLAKILRNFDLEVDEANPPVKIADVITRAKNGLMLKIKKRNV